MDTETKVVIGICSAGALLMILVIAAAINDTRIQRAMYDECTQARPQYECYAMIYKGKMMK
jgi:hypothetical protein